MDKLVPCPVLLAPGISASAKLICLLLRPQTGGGPAGPADPALLASQSGLSRKTVVKALSELADVVVQRSQAPAIHMPPDLLVDQSVGIQGRLLYGHIQMLPTFTHPRGRFTYTHLSALTGICRPTLRQAVKELVDAGWLEVEKEHRRALTRFLICNPIVDKGQAEVVRAQWRLAGVKWLGEVLMREYLSLLIASDQFQDNATPGFLVNPFTDEYLQFDRFYPPTVAFEYNGPQHDGPTDLFSAETAAQQQGRDLIKLGICARRGITLVVVHARDLTLAGMRQRIGTLLPLRNLHGHEPLIAFLKSESRRCRCAPKRYDGQHP
ncbi:MAG: hypothetical protein JWN15_2806 [Firmicutes bacterium]|nr:hypothetical protein [Bacillota bacterium]